ncbi:MAG: alpha/beta fold hydrolase [Myxococcota bacterium]
MRPRSRFVPASQGLRLNLLEWSPQGPPLIFLHGFGHSARIWSPFAADFQAHYRTLALDQRGHGDSDRDPQARYSHGSMCADLAAVLDGLGLRRVCLVGHSMGGYIALHYTARHPARVGHLVLVDAGPELRPARITGSGTDHEHAGAGTLSVDPALLRPRADQERWARREGKRLWEALECVRCPTLVIRGGRSPLLSRATARRMIDEALSRSEAPGTLVEIPDAGHDVMLDQPEAFRRALKDFLLPPEL